MTDLVVGLGEIGRPIKQLLEKRGFVVESYDIKFSGNCFKKKYDFIHICIPYNDYFEKNVKQWKPFGTIVIHSTVRPGTSKELGCIYSPVRGVHSRMLKDLEYYTKWYSGKINKEFERRFYKTKNISDSTILENTKILVDTTYLGWLVMFRKLVDDKYNVDWSFAHEIDDKLGNRPVMYNDFKPIGGHCVIQNLDLLDDDTFAQIIRNDAITCEV